MLQIVENLCKIKCDMSFKIDKKRGYLCQTDYFKAWFIK